MADRAVMMGELLKAAIAMNKGRLDFKPIFGRNKEILDSLTPLVEEMKRYNNMMDAVGSMVLNCGPRPQLRPQRKGCFLTRQNCISTVIATASATFIRNFPQLPAMRRNRGNRDCNLKSLGSIDRTDVTVNAISFTWTVDSAIRSRTPSTLGASPAHSFASVVDSAIRSPTASDLGTSPVHDFASVVDMRTTSARLSQVSNATEHVAARFFTLAELVAATNNFSLDNKIGVGEVYRGKLADGGEVAIKRVETWLKRKRMKSELAFLFRLHHRNLVGLVGFFCDEKYERLSVYEYMKNGALYDHLHDKNNVEKGSSVLNYWKMRIKIALDASRGIEYLHNYADPSIIHRNIKSSNILLDATWTARVSDFELSMMVSPEEPADCDYRPMKAAGTIGYIDPEYCGLNVLTAKSDVYGLGVVLLELLTGKRAIFKSGEDDGIGTPLSVIEFAVPAILAGELGKILDPRVGPPDVNEAEAVELVARTAIHCVNFKGKDRPAMVDIVINLEQALAICDSSHDAISTIVRKY